MLPNSASASFIHDVARMAELSAAIGEGADAARYSGLLRKLKPEWHAAFWDPVAMHYGAGTQVHLRRCCVTEDLILERATRSSFV